ncbi:hypothetical protein ABNF97_24615 [Plantactinospora sp. B6F1]|uniref:hypothetical protein n=1 Tax=Plantactinospora sp. B6F1 TaxID=3158971 RepID=UPI0032D9A518
MLTRRLRRAAVLVAALLMLAGCLLPSHDYYGFGVARIGDTFHIFAPICADERIVEVDAIDNVAAGKESFYDPAETRYSYWRVVDPADESAAQGWIVLGDDSAYRRVLVAAGSGVPLPEVVAVELRVVADGKPHKVGDTFRPAEVPSYPAGTDPKTVEYGWQLSTSEPKKLTAEQIRERSKCARDYPA